MPVSSPMVTVATKSAVAVGHKFEVSTNDSIDVDNDSIPDGCDDIIDSDSDGIEDQHDLCPDTSQPNGLTSDANGCDLTQIDTDGD